MTDSGERNPVSTTEKNTPERFSLRIKRWLHSDAFKCVLMDIAASLIIMVILFFVCVPKKYDLTINSIAPETIKATKDVTDEVTTRKRREDAAQEAAANLDYNKYITEDLLSYLKSATDELSEVQQYGQSLRDAAAGAIESSDIIPDTEATEIPEITSEQSANSAQPYEYSTEEIQQASLYVNSLNLTEDQVLYVMQMSRQEFDSMVLLITESVKSVLTNNKFYEDQPDQINETVQNLLADETLAPYQIILPKLLEICIKPNVVIDVEAIEKARQDAMDAVEPVVYLQGRTIVREGDPLGENQLAMLRSLGLLNDQDIDYSVYGGSAIAVLVSMICFFMSLKLLRAEILTDVRKMAVVLIVLILSVAVAAIAHLLPSQYVIPLAMGAILGTVLIGYRIGICLTFALSLLFASLTSGNASSTFFDVVLLMSMTISESVLCIWFLKGRPQRVRVLIAGPLCAVVGFVMVIGIKLLTSSGSVDVLSVGAWLFGGGVLSGVLAVAFQPALEQLFRLATPSRLLELTNPNQPLMKRLMIEAPGTYHHSIIVANLAEAAADQIQANPYLARAGAYYHDIGKLKRPGYFKENQNGDNPHERTDPYVSAAILISHTMDGVLLAQKEHMPREVQDIILQHHGVTPVMFFYHKALQMSDGSHVDIDEFRYSGPKPNTKEAAIVMLADTIEAAVRSMKDPTPKGIDQFIERLVRGKLEDGQLSESPLSLSDIDQICDAFSGILKGVYHERIEYPNVPHYAGKKVPVPDSSDKKASAASDSNSSTVSPVHNEKAESDTSGTPSEKGKDETSNDA